MLTYRGSSQIGRDRRIVRGVTSSAAAARSSLLFGTNNFGPDFSTFTGTGPNAASGVNAGGIAFSFWGRAATDLVPPWDRGNVEFGGLRFGNGLAGSADGGWHCRVVGVNGQASDPNDGPVIANLNANSMVFTDNVPGVDSNNEFSDESFLRQDNLTVAEANGWVYHTFQIITSATAITIRMWLVFGLGATPIGPIETDVGQSFSSTVAHIRAWMQEAGSGNSASGADAAAWSPSGHITGFDLGSTNGLPGYMVNVRLAELSADPSSANITAWSLLTAPDAGAWAFYPYAWVAGAPVLTDAGSGHHNTTTSGGVFFQGPNAPV